MKKNYLFKPVFLLTVLTSLLLMLFSNCKKDDENNQVPYSNMDDNTTTNIKLTIPRIELSSLKSTNIKLYLSVTDQEGNPIKNFNQYNFEIKQVCTGEMDTTLIGTVSLSEPNQDGNNIAISTTMDYSGSMADSDIENMEDAIKYFVDLKSNNDYMEIIKFATQVNVVQDFTSSESELLYAIDNIPYQGGTGTAFYSAVNQGVIDAQEFYQTNPIFLPAILAFTDGGDNASNISLSSLIDKAQLNQIPVYTIGFGNPNMQNMNVLADETGGRYYFTPNAAQLTDLYSLISGQLKNLYIAEWVYDNPDCDEVTIVVKSSYSCANGDFVSFSTKTFYPLD